MRGLNLDLERAHQDGTEYRFGALSQPGIVSIPLADREKFLPPGEDQNMGEEKYWCASASPLNALAALFTYHYQHNMQPENKKWLQDNGYTTYDKVDFSDSFVAINSGTTRGGNSLKAPLQAIHAQGLVPKSRLPQLPGFDETYDPKRITQELKDMGTEFARRFTITYEQINNIHIAEALKDDFVGVALFGWPQPVGGVYPRVDDDFNHAICLFAPQYAAFDNYEASAGYFIKELAPDYKMYDYGYRVIITAENPNATVQLTSLYQRLIAVLLKIRDILST